MHDMRIPCMLHAIHMLVITLVLRFRRGIILTHFCNNRSLPHIIGTASYLVLSRIFSLFKAGVRLPFLNLYAFECLLQVLLDLKQLCVISTQSTRSLSSSSLNVVWAVVSVGLNSAYRAWESEATCEPPTPTAHGAKVH